MEKEICRSVVKVGDWWSKNPRYMGKIETANTKLRKYIYKNVEVIIREVTTIK